MSVLITGSSSSIGSILVKFLISKNIDCTILIRDKRVMQNDKIKKIHCDLLNDNFEIPDSINIVCNLASILPKSTKNPDYNKNLLITQNLIKKIKKHKKIKKIINFSTMAVYSSTQIKVNSQVNEKTSLFSIDEYSVSKLKCEKMLNSLECDGVFNLRIPGVLINNNSNNFITNVINKIFKKQNFDLYNKENLFNNLISIEDLSNFILNLIKHDYKKGTVLLAASEPISLFSLIEYLKDKFNSSSTINWKNNKNGFYIDILNAQQKYRFQPLTTIETIDKFIFSQYNI